MTKVSSSTIRPFTDAANEALVIHEKITLSSRTRPLLASTFSMPKIFCRAATPAGSTRPPPPSSPPAAALAIQNTASAAVRKVKRCLVIGGHLALEKAAAIRLRTSQFHWTEVLRVRTFGKMHSRNLHRASGRSDSAGERRWQDIIIIPFTALLCCVGACTSSELPRESRGGLGSCMPSGTE